MRWDHVSPSGLMTKTVVTVTSVDQHDVPSESGTLLDARSTMNLAPIAYRMVHAVRASTAIQKATESSLWSITPYVRHDVLDLLSACSTRRPTMAGGSCVSSNGGRSFGSMAVMGGEDGVWQYPVIGVQGNLGYVARSQSSVISPSYPGSVHTKEVHERMGLHLVGATQVFVRRVSFDNSGR